MGETNFRNSSTAGILLEDLDRPEIRALPSVIDIFPSVRPGEELKITVDLATSPGTILQCHPKLEVCFEDIQKIREMEAEFLYKVADPKTQARDQGCLALLWQALCCLCSSSAPTTSRPSRPVP